MLLIVNVTSGDVTYCKCYKPGCYLVLVLQARMLLIVNVTTSEDVTYC